MSLDIRYLRNKQGNKIYVVTNKAFKPPTIEVYQTADEIPTEIRHYAPEKAEFCNEDCAIKFRIDHILYPKLKNCVLIDYNNEKCIKTSCKHVDCKNYK